MAEDKKAAVEEKPAAPVSIQAEKLPRSVWIRHSRAIGCKPEVAAAALAGIEECSKEEAMKAVAAFLKAPADFSA